MPIYLQGGTYGSTIYFNVYGEETRSPERSVSFESEVTETIQPGADKVILDQTKPESYVAVTQEAHTGYKAKLWKIVTENGEETRTQVNSSTYSASPRYVTKGAKKVAAPTRKPAATKKPNNREETSESEDQEDSDRRRSKQEDVDHTENDEGEGAEEEELTQPVEAQ